MMSLVGIIPAMAGGTGKYRVIVGILMTVAAGTPFVRMGAAVDREGVMYEIRTVPAGCRVALRTVERESCGDMSRIGCIGVIIRMACIAVRRKAGVLAAAVAVKAIELYMPSRQRELGAAVVEDRVLPRN